MKNKNQTFRCLARRSSTWQGCLTLTFCALAAGQAMAQSTWSGATSINWNVAGNWDSIPVDNGALIFGGTPANQPTANDFPALIAGAISFNNAGPHGTAPNNVTTVFTLGGNAITLSGGITNAVVGQPNVVGNTAIDITDTISSNLILSSPQTITTNTGGGTGGNRVSHNLTISGGISDGGAGHGLTKAGGAVLTLSNINNPFSGPLTINSGVVVASVLEVSGSASSIGTGSVINLSSGTLRFTGSTALSGSFNRAINLTSTAAAGGSIENNGSVPLTINGVVSSTASGGVKPLGLGGSNNLTNELASSLVNHTGGGALSVTKFGLGNWTLTGNNLHTGITDINQGNLFVATIADSGPSNLGPGTLFKLGTGGQAGNLNYTGTGATTVRQLRVGGGSAAATGVGAILISAANGTSTGLKFTATNFISQSTDTAARVLVIGGPNTDANEISGTITNHGTGVGTGVLAITKADLGLWILSGNSTYSGVTTISGGTLQVNNSNGLGSSTATNAINLNPNPPTNQSTLSLRNNGAGNNGTIIYGSTSNPSGYNLQLSTPINTINVDNLTANTGNTIQLGMVTSTGNRTLNVTGANGYSLTLSSLSLSPGTGQNTTLIPTTASVIVSGNVTNPMSGFGVTNFDSLTLDGTSTGNRVLGVISDAVGGSEALGGLTRVIKSGLSTWELLGANTNDGITTISAGTLLINGNSSGATGAVTVNGGVFGGTGTIGGSVTVAAGGSLSPGSASAATFSIGGGLTISAMADGGTGKLIFGLGPIASSDKLAAAGTLEIGTDFLGFSDFNFSALAGLEDGTYTLITSSGITGSLDPDSADLTGPVGSRTGVLQLNGNNIELVVTSGGDPYIAWSGGAPFDGDANNDGVDNGLAWLLNAANPNVNATSLLPSATQSVGNLTLSFDMLPLAERDGAQLFLEHSSDLGISDLWTSELVPDTNDVTGPVTFTISGTDPLDVTATVSSSQAAGAKLFSRLRAVR